MSVFLGAAVFLFGAGFLMRSVTAARMASWAGPRSRGMRERSQRSGGQMRPLRHEVRLIRENARTTDWLERQRHLRAGRPLPAKPPSPAGKAASGARRAAGGAVRVIRGTVTRPQAPAAPQASAAPHAPQPGGGAAAPPPAPSPAPPPRPAPSMNGSSGGNPTVASGNGSVEKFIEGVNQVHAEAAAGGIHAKHAGIKACNEGALRFSAMAAMLARAMSEPASNYGPEITEPVAKASVHLQAAAMAFSEADTNLTTLMAMTVGDLASSPRQAPHTSELTESGAH